MLEFDWVILAEALPAALIAVPVRLAAGVR
jgi:hypothetical protein